MFPAGFADKHLVKCYKSSTSSVNCQLNNYLGLVLTYRFSPLSGDSALFVDYLLFAGIENL